MLVLITFWRKSFVSIKQFIQLRYLNSNIHQSLPDLCSLPECPKHSAKHILHSAKGLPSAVLGKLHTAIVVTEKQALSSAFSQALGKALPCAKTLSTK